ncbi:MAG: 30S ribosomal protein S17 [archaeon]|nr:30S ribosomal protein S17 [archaeon]
MTEKKNKTEKEQKVSAVAGKEKNVGTRGRTFEGFVTKKFPKRVVVEFERKVYVKKYERFYKKITRLHARLPDSMANDINVGDHIQIRECRPLSKIINFMVIKKVRSDEQEKAK